MYFKAFSCPDNKKIVNDVVELNKKISSDVICYGSENAVKIMSYIEEMFSKIIDDEKKFSFEESIAAYVVLAMQIKYDTTGIKTSARVWYISKFTTDKIREIGNFYEESMSKIEYLVDKLNLPKFLKEKVKLNFE